MQVVITVVGFDKVGILARVSAICAENGANIEDVTQTILRGTFAMVMIAALPEDGVGFGALAGQLREAGKELEVDIRITRQDIFDAMHRV